ncbi:hypothetical protein [Methylorubrum extorquens]|uniref:Phage holin family protein n=1 Tax=Methylorubrum extorquens TaxID=408 RepID=A0AAX3WI65_METEX|nr:hypothetical protein [Methylorubrum extorquens]MCG5248750.1 hypothetical protein [Methylorubrum extorquens]MCP1545852.1 hypothetical protein [Methylorubrum extorquens]MCP1591803.1 hypothetical protein [Methylorubrum extorquens]WHQ71056.1 hypothetical protein KEC54_05525 [Methylorubrum extorquens]GEL44520.1 hypothetical protein MEX01_51110 [Methylorubrum extorquens]
MNAPLRKIEGGPYEPTGFGQQDVVAIGRFTVSQPAYANTYIKLGHKTAERLPAANGQVMFPTWIRVAFVFGVAGLFVAFGLSSILFLFDSPAVYWLTGASLAVGVTALAGSLTGAKKHVGRAGRSAEAKDAGTVRAEVRSA